MRTWNELKETIYNISLFLEVLFTVSLFVAIGITIIFLANSMFGYTLISLMGVVVIGFMLYYTDKVADLLAIAKFDD